MLYFATFESINSRTLFEIVLRCDSLGAARYLLETVKMLTKKEKNLKFLCHFYVTWKIWKCIFHVYEILVFNFSLFRFVCIKCVHVITIIQIFITNDLLLYAVVVYNIIMQNSFVFEMDWNVSSFFKLQILHLKMDVISKL